MLKKDECVRSYIFDENIALIMFIGGVIQGISYRNFTKSVIILGIEEIILLLFILKEEIEIYKHNRLIKNGEIIYAEYNYVKTHCTSMTWRGTQRYLMHFYCDIGDKTYKKQLHVGSDKGYIDSIYDLVSNQKIPVIVDDNGNYYVMINELIIEHLWFNKPNDEKNKKINLCYMLLRYVVFWMCSHF